MCRDIGHKLCYSLKIFLDHFFLVRKGLKFQFEKKQQKQKRNKTAESYLILKLLEQCTNYSWYLVPQ